MYYFLFSNNVKVSKPFVFYNFLKFSELNKLKSKHPVRVVVSIP